MFVDEVWRTRADGAIPTARYTAAEFARWEHQRLWSRVWQVAGREEQLPNPGDMLEYEIGLVSVLEFGKAVELCLPLRDDESGLGRHLCVAGGGWHRRG